MADSVQKFAPLNNPFSVDRIRPGTIPFLFSHHNHSTDIEQLDRLVDHWLASGCIGQIVGPHGCGKTTLAHTIANRVIERKPGDFGRFHLATLQKTTRRWINAVAPKSDCQWPGSFQVTNSTPVGESLSNRVKKLNAVPQSKNILIVDGIEHLPTLQRAIMMRSLAVRRVPTLVTAHGALRELPFAEKKWPVLFQVGSDIRMLTKIASLLTESTDSLEDSAIESAFRSANGNCRDALMELYDSCATSKFT